jgi:hypothetical protein
MVQKGVETVPPSTWECSRRLQRHPLLIVDLISNQPTDHSEAREPNVLQLQLASTIQRGRLLG